ncbi:HD domain-containing protein [Priestia megaterium]|nr:HD domain-containing protein [Priestia megaterium]
MKQVIDEAEEWVKKKLAHDRTGHDWQHISRVRANALFLSEKEGGNENIIELAALLHDVVDDKLVEDVEAAYKEVECWLAGKCISKQDIAHIIQILRTMSFKGGNRPRMTTLEGQIVQDADRLDAIGAIGIARTFMYAGSKGTALYDENMTVKNHMSEEEYRNGKSTAIAHFYEKLLQLKELMNTTTAKEMASERHTYMENFLAQFKREWNYCYENDYN